MSLQILLFLAAAAGILGIAVWRLATWNTDARSFITLRSFLSEEAAERAREALTRADIPSRILPMGGSGSWSTFGGGPGLMGPYHLVVSHQHAQRAEHVLETASHHGPPQAPPA